MSCNDKGLTVGELTIAICALLFAAFLWSSMSKNENDSKTELRTINISSFVQELPKSI